MNSENYTISVLDDYTNDTIEKVKQNNTKEFISSLSIEKVTNVINYGNIKSKYYMKPQPIKFQARRRNAIYSSNPLNVQIGNMNIRLQNGATLHARLN